MGPLKTSLSQNCPVNYCMQICCLLLMINLAVIHMSILINSLNHLRERNQLHM